MISNLSLNILKIVLILQLNKAVCEDDVSAVLASNIRECYENGDYRDRNNLQPMTLSVFLDLLRKIEDTPGNEANMRQLATGILHALRQDGIVYDPSASSTEGVIPYKPTGFQAYKNRLLMRKLLPNNHFKFPEDSLTTSEKCTLHHMVSSTIAINTRGDEGIVCPSLVQAARDKARYRSNGVFSVEILNIKNSLTDRSLGNLIVGPSLCPIEEGVIYTEWGTLTAGTILAGISAGLESQMVLVSDLVDINHGEALNDSFVVDNKYASTVAGDMAEAALRQGVAKGSITLGAPGSWNSTTLRRQYFLDRSEHLEMTDAEIIAGIDGLILSDLAGHYVETFPELKLSQYIDMYFSEKGIFHESRFRACNRQSLMATVAPTDILMQQSFAFGLALNEYMPMAGSLTIDGINAYARSASESLYSYVASSIKEQPCSTTVGEVERTSINLILVADITRQMYPHISYIVEQIDVGKFGSSITLLEPSNGNVIIDKTFSPSTFHESFIKVMSNSGVFTHLQLANVLRSINNTITSEYSPNDPGGNTTVVLFFVSNVQLSNQEFLECMNLIYFFRSKHPDVHILFATSSTSRDLLESIINNKSNMIGLNFASLSSSSSELIPIVDRLKSIPAKLFNPFCGTGWNGQVHESVSFTCYLDAEGIKFFRIQPNYFYGANDERKIVILNPDQNSINLCFSRSDEHPRQNRTSSQIPADVTCQSITAGNTEEIRLAGACNGYSSIDQCPPFYFSVSVNTFTRTATCKDRGCRYPDDVKVTITALKLGCYSCAHKIFVNIIVLIGLYAIKMLI